MLYFREVLKCRDPPTLRRRIFCQKHFYYYYILGKRAGRRSIQIHLSNRKRTLKQIRSSGAELSVT